MKKLGKLLGAAACVTAVGSAFAYLTTKLLVDAATEREQPKIIEKAQIKISGSGVDEEFLKVSEQCSEKLKNLPLEEMRITSFDGTPLVGHWYPCENEKRIIVAMHGWRSSWYKDFGMIADFWNNNGCSVLFAEQRGQQGSGGSHICFGLSERYDCLEWIKFINATFGDEKPIYLAGISMGAATVLMTAGLDLPQNVHGIMADCGFTSPKEIWRHVTTHNLHLSYRLHGFVADEMFKRKLNMGTDDYSTIEAMKNCHVPVLFIHGTDDNFVPVRMTYENYAACAAPKQLLIVPGADHGMSYYIERERYEKQVLEFWKEFD